MAGCSDFIGVPLSRYYSWGILWYIGLIWKGRSFFSGVWSKNLLYAVVSRWWELRNSLFGFVFILSSVLWFHFFRFGSPLAFLFSGGVRIFAGFFGFTSLGVFPILPSLLINSCEVAASAWLVYAWFGCCLLDPSEFSYFFVEDLGSHFS